MSADQNDASFVTSENLQHMLCFLRNFPRIQEQYPDGAEWIWALVDDLFPDSVQIVDWFHATQHLSLAAQALFPDQPDQVERWYTQQRTIFFRGEIWKITRALDHAGLTEHSHYFHTHQRRMQYQEFREQGYPIGSGTIENGVK